MPDDRYDLVVIGGGSAGLTAAGFAAAVGARVLIAAERLGGDCTWTGCIPSKTLIRVARQVHDARNPPSTGGSAREPMVDFTHVMADVHAAVERVYALETPEELAKRRVEVAIGTASFVDRESIQVADRLVRAEHLIVCTGATPVVPDIPGLDAVRVLTYETFFDLERMPASLVVVGAGATGLELAQALGRLGSNVSVVEQRAQVLPDVDSDAAAVIHRRLQGEGIRLYLSSAVSSVSAVGSRLELRVRDDHLQAEGLLIAAGRRPRIEGLELGRAGIDVRDGAIRVDKNLRTTNPLVHAAGDVTGGFQFTHYAGWQGYIAARNALLPGTQDGTRANVPWVVFTDPEIAQAGWSEVQARTQFSDVRVLRMELDRVDRAQTEGETDGFLKLVTAGSGKLIGATVVSRVAGETINELALAIDRGLTLSELAGTIHAYPTFGFAIQQLAAEASMEAAASGIRGRAISALRRLS